jgi:hypothetical protein
MWSWYSQMKFRKLKLDWQYGLSELLIVVAGVLIALAADGLLEERSLRQTERASLRRLASDMEVDIADLTGNLTRTRRVLEGATWLMERRNGQLPPLDSLNLRLTDYTACSNLDANTSEYEMLRSSGQLGILRDAEFRQQMVNHYERYTVLSDRYSIDCDLVDQGVAAIESLVEFGVDPTGEAWPMTVTGRPSDVLENATFQRTVAILANRRLFVAPVEEALIATLLKLRDRALEMARD